MDHQSRTILAMAARILSYPEDSYVHELIEIEASLGDEFASEQLRQELQKAVRPLIAKSLGELRKIYVQTFDLKDSTGLYLTGHELGDSRERGVALLKLQAMIRGAGFISREDELFDFIPMLYELLAVAEESEPLKLLAQRLSIATQRIRNHLGEDHLYLPIFSVLMSAVFEVPSEEEMKKLDQGRKAPDLDPMPYPLMYR